MSGIACVSTCLPIAHSILVSAKLSLKRRVYSQLPAMPALHTKIPLTKPYWSSNRSSTSRTCLQFHDSSAAPYSYTNCRTGTWSARGRSSLGLSQTQKTTLHGDVPHNAETHEYRQSHLSPTLSYQKRSPAAVDVYSCFRTAFSALSSSSTGSTVKPVLLLFHQGDRRSYSLRLQHVLLLL